MLNCPEILAVLHFYNPRKRGRGDDHPLVLQVFHHSSTFYLSDRGGPGSFMVHPDCHDAMEKLFQVCAHDEGLSL